MVFLTERDEPLFNSSRQRPFPFFLLKCDKDITVTVLFQLHILLVVFFLGGKMEETNVTIFHLEDEELGFYILGSNIKNIFRICEKKMKKKELSSVTF